MASRWCACGAVLRRLEPRRTYATMPQTPPPSTAKPQSSVAAGTPLKGLGIYKGLGDPVAKEDHEYPDWLWDLASEGGAMGAGREDSPVRAMRRELNKQNRDSIRASNFLKNKRK